MWFYCLDRFSSSQPQPAVDRLGATKVNQVPARSICWKVKGALRVGSPLPYCATLHLWRVTQRLTCKGHLIWRMNYLLSSALGLTNYIFNLSAHKLLLLFVAPKGPIVCRLVWIASRHQPFITKPEERRATSSTWVPVSGKFARLKGFLRMPCEYPARE